MTDTTRGVLDAVRLSRRSELREQADQLVLACTWADQHPAESIDDGAACFGDSPMPVAGQGAPLVAEFCIAEFAAALGLSTDAGKYLVGEALELRHRLPRLWARVQDLTLPAWRARRIARKTIGLSPAAAGFVDDQIAHIAHKVGPISTDKILDQAIATYMPEVARAEREQALERRHLRIDHRQVSFAGTSRVCGELDLADALDLDAAISTEAHRLRTQGATEDWDVLRALALANLGRRYLGPDHGPDHGLDTPQADQPPTRETVIVVHLARDGVTATVDNTGTVVTLDQVRQWCTNPFTKVTIKPVIDLDDHVQVASYQASTNLKEHVELRDRTCVFPWCTRPARGCDKDHTVPHRMDGTTCSCNLAPLCRRHHRLKTHHGAWIYTTLEPGTYLWTSPHGYQFLRNHTGTEDLNRHRERPAKAPPDG